MDVFRESDWKTLKSIARHLRSYPRVLFRYKYQESPHFMEAIVDTDFAGCRRTRKSTNGSCVVHGIHLVKSWSTTETVITMSSEEAEHYGVVQGACEAMRVVSLLQDLTGRRSDVGVNKDSNAASSIAMRRGVGEVRHLEVRTLWLQDTKWIAGWSRSPRSRVKPNPPTRAPSISADES